VDADPAALTTLGWQAATAWAGVKLFGPTLDSIGQALSRFTDYRLKNAEKITEKAIRKAGRALDEEGSVHPRVAHRLIEEGSYIDDDVMQEYVAGLLVGNRRTKYQATDRAAYFVNLVASLTAAQVQIHHAVYSALVGTAGQGRSLRSGLASSTCTVICRGEDVLKIVSGSRKPHKYLEFWPVVNETVDALKRDGLIEDYGIGGSHPHIRSDEALFAAVPTVIGADLFMAAYGFPPVFPDTILTTSKQELAPFEPPGPTLPSSVRIDNAASINPFTPNVHRVHMSKSLSSVRFEEKRLDHQDDM
jgi:hypothetical protein